MKLIRSLLLSFFALLLLSGGAGEACALTLKQVRFGQHPGKTRMVLDLDREAPYRVFTLSDPWRLVIDLPDFGWQAGTIEKPAWSGVADIRQGKLDEAMSRIVIDFNNPLVVKSVFFLPRSGQSGDRLVIDFASASVADAMAAKGRLFGKLEDRVGAPAAEPAVTTAHVAAAAPAPAIKPPPAQATPPVPEPAPAVIPAVAPGGMVLPPRKPERTEYKKPLIIIDAGHGGKDPGAQGPDRLLEKEVTLSMAKTLKKHLEDTGRYEVRLTRESDMFLRLYERVDFARKHRGDLFISLHADSIGKSGVRGASVYTLSEKASDKETAQLAMRENRADLIAGVDLSAEDETVVNILVDLAMRDTMNQSKFLANKTVDTMKARDIRLLENPHRYAGFAVLKAPDVPSILVEMGFLSTPTEARMLISPAFQKKLAEALTASLDAYFAQVRRNQRS